MSLSRFDSEFQSHALTDLLADRGVSVTYTPSGSSAVSIYAEIVPENQQLQRVGPDGVARAEYPREIRVSQSDVATVTVGADQVAIPKFPNSGATTTYKVVWKNGEPGGSWHLGLR